jgi:serine/threonine protein kinase
MVGRYEIVGELGRGGMAVVYEAIHVELGKTVALKELVLGAADAHLAERFLREARTSGALDHPNVVSVFDYFEHDGRPYIAMEHVPGGSLRPLVGQLTLSQIAGVLEGVLAGLAHAERHGIVHRDLKPENLLVTAEGRMKIADFGIAKAVDRTAVGHSLTGAGMTVGTPTYMAPEQARAERIGPPADLYSLGVIAYELLTGRPPFGDADTPVAAILMQHISSPVPDPLERRPDIDPAIAAWTLRMLAKEPAARPAGALQAWDELEPEILRLLGARWRRSAPLPVPAPRPSLPPAPFETPSREEEYDTYAPYPDQTPTDPVQPVGAEAAAPPSPPAAAPPPPSPVVASGSPPTVAPAGESPLGVAGPPAAEPPTVAPAAGSPPRAVGLPPGVAPAGGSPSPGAAGPPPAEPPAGGSREDAAPPAGPPEEAVADGRSRRPLTAVLLAAAVAVLVAAAALGLSDAGQKTPKGGAAAAGPTATRTPTATATATTAALTEGDVVHQIADILSFSAIGRQQRVAGDFDGALANRQEVLKRVQALEQRTDLLKPDLQRLENAAQKAIVAVQAYKSCGGSDCAPTQTRASAQAKQEFTQVFNPLAQRYLHRTYGVADF